jgi:hypothetical protein
MFEGFDGQTSAPPSGKQHWARSGVNATPAPGNGSLPPGHPTFSMNKPKGAKTTKAHLKAVGD